MKNIIITLIFISITVGFSQQNDKYTIKHLNECNDELSNFGTTFYNENQMIYASPKKKSVVIKNIWYPNNQPFLELYIADIAEDGELVNRIKLNEAVNTRFHEADVVYTNDKKTVYFTRDNYYQDDLRADEKGMTHLAMFKADVINSGEWTNIVEMPFNNPYFSVGHPTLTNDNKTLFFISDMPGSFGKTDIYKVSINEDGSYGKPINLGIRYNTIGREMFSFIGDNDVLYFSSDARGGLGGLDVYAIELNKDNQPVALAAPINSESDDFAYIKKEDYGYFSSNREGGKGDDDIYYFKELQAIDFPCNQIAEGVVTNKETGEIIPYAEVTLLDDKGIEVDHQKVGRNAKFSFKIDCKSKYKVIGSKENYSEDNEEFVSNTNLKLGLDLGLNLNKLDKTPNNDPKPNSPVTQLQYDSCQNALDLVNNIFFDLDKSYIRPDASSELDKVVRIMKRCKNIKVSATSHTDSRASAEYNLILSQKRAQATVDYIINIGGINSDRINAIGYGETLLKNKCKDGISCTEIEHQVNRRTQFEIFNY
ncbi:MAG: OmpA family protein [Flavobacteriaceae bacterium]